MYDIEYNSNPYRIKRVNLETEESKVVSGWPTEGSSVRRWNWKTKQWEKWTDSSGWVRWQKPYQSTQPQIVLVRPPA